MPTSVPTPIGIQLTQLKITVLINYNYKGMNKKFLSWAFYDKTQRCKHFFRIMKLTTLFLFVLILCLHAENTNSQNVRVTIKQQNAELENVLSLIESQTDYLFIYNKYVNVNRKVSVNLNKRPLKEVLSQLFEGTNVKYTVDGAYILLSPKEDENDNASSGISQDRNISGCVKDTNGEPVIGANVSVKGTTIGTITDIDGLFMLEVPKDAVILVSYIGYISQEVKVGNKTRLDILLKEDSQALDEVVVVGYGTQKKVNLTGAVTAVSGKEMTKRPVTNTSTMLQGQVPGLRVVQGTGQPGDENVSFRIRGVGTFSGAGSNPLVLVNGVPGDMSALDPSMIESVSVLKDAASCAIYGARAANGVILITTKQGATNGDKVSISYSGNFAVHTPTKMFDLVTNSADYMTLFNIAKTNSGEGGLYSEEEIAKYRNSNGSVEYPSFDWLDYTFNPAFVHQHNLSLAGTANRTTYNVALNFVDQDGTMKKSGYKKYNVTADLATQATDWMRVGFYTNLMKGDRVYYGHGQDDAILSAMSQAPTYMPWLPDDGTGVKRYTKKAYDNEVMNKNMAMMFEQGLHRHTDINTDVNVQLWLDISLAKGLTWYTKGAVRQVNTRSEYWRGNPQPVYNYHTGVMAEMQGGYGYSVDENRTFYTNFYTYLKYEFTTPNKNHNFSLMAGYNQESNKYETLKAYRRDYDFDLPVIDAGAGAPNWSNEGKVEEWALMSGFFRFNYNFKERYLFEANARYDGSSRLSPEGRWGLFPSFSGAWRLTEEEFVKDLNLSWLSNAKIRASWGKLGNQEIGLYPYQAMISKVSSYTFDKSSISPAYMQTAYVNRNIKWETTTITDIGVDLSLFNRLNVTFDWYRKETDGILRSAQISGLLGMGAPTINNGTMRDKGIELAFSWNDHINKGILKGLDYNLGFYVDRTRNTLSDFGVTEKDGKVIREEGLPYNSYYMLDCIGIFATQEEIDKAPKQYSDNTLPGDLRYRDANNDGVINDDDRTLISGRYPAFEYGFNAGASWKGFDISVLTQGVSGMKCYINPNWGEAPFYQGSAPTKDYVEGMWTEENPYNAKYPRLYYQTLGGGKNTRTNSFFLKNTSYFRLKNLTVGYTLPKQLTEKVRMEKVRLYFSGDNLLTITKYDGLDPERKGDGVSTQYPQNRICSIGINVEF